MSEFVESAKRLHTKGIVTKDKLDKWLKDNVITQDEYNYIIKE